MTQHTPIINILTYQLPFDLSNQIYKEYQSRWKEVLSLIEFKPYTSLKKELATVDLLLALSIFHKRVIVNLDAAIKFHGRVTRNSEADSIRIGSYSFSEQEKRKLQALVINYQQLLRRFHLSENIFSYLETREFLRNLIEFKNVLNDA